LTNVSAFFSEFLGTAILAISIFAMTDKNNLPPPSGLAPLLLAFVLLGLATSLGMGTGSFHSLFMPINPYQNYSYLAGFAVNPARDFGPRLLSSMVGYGKAVYTFRK
jgi:aquaglyceroporin related protein